jgi:hypothetical protein
MLAIKLMSAEATNGRRFKLRLSFVCTVVGVLVLGVAIIVPNLLPPRVVNSRNACVADLEYLQRMKKEWAARVNAPGDAIPTMGDLFGTNWTEYVPRCPAGGTYTIGKVSENPRCSIGPPAHVLR